MISINKISINETVDFAASELKKYIRMMQPNGGDVKIAYCPNSVSGFRIGLMQDFDLDVSDADDTALDDILYIDADKNGGIIAGDNPRSVLLAVYEFLRQNGCRWLFPGVDGEFVPIKDLEAVKYRFKPSMRYRGPCIEGAVTQEILLDTLDFIPKVGMNLFQMQFLVPTVFYTRYYEHRNNTSRPPEPISTETMLQWKAMCEAEISKRGIEFHDVGHGWTIAPFGIDASAGWDKIDDSTLPESSTKYLAMLDGERKLYKGVPLNTQFCMSNSEARTKIAEHIAAYAEIHSNVDYIHVWLGDGHNNHCECAECAKKTVSDWYMLLLNEIDEKLTEKGLENRIVFCAYTETSWAPLQEKLNNPSRFALMLGPISRSYTKTLTGRAVTLPKFVRNKIEMPADLDEYMAHIREWKKVWPGACLCYEYHFWKHQIFEPSGLLLAERVIKDVEAYKDNGFDGMIACGSQRCYFPTGFAFYAFARKQFDISLSYGEILKEYFSCAFGEDYLQFVSYLSEIAQCFGDKYLEGEESADIEKHKYFNPKRADELRKIPAVLEKGKAIISSHYNSADRIKTASVRILEQHNKYCGLLANTFVYLADGNEAKSLEAYKEFEAHMNTNEIYTEKYLEHYIALRYIYAHIKYNF